MPICLDNNSAAYSAPGAVSQAVFGKESRICGRTQRSEPRSAREARRPATVSVVMILSKIPVRKAPDRGRGWQDDEKIAYPYSICGRGVATEATVKVHMAPCVNKNGKSG